MPTKKPKELGVSEEHEVAPLDDDTSFFYSFDMGLATALISVGFSLVSLDRQNLSKVQFVFRRGDGMNEVVDAYWADRLEVKARTYFDTLKMLKNRLHSE
jgi:hypothetical protein